MSPRQPDTGSDPERLDALLASLLPRVFWARDATRGGDVLAALIAALAGQYGTLRDSVAGIYDDLFVATCGADLVPYIGAEIGIDGLATHPPQAIDRAWVAQATAFRRSKGSLATAAWATAAASGWSTYIQDGGEVCAHTQWLGDPQPRRGETLDLRDRRLLRELDAPWSTASRGAMISTRAPSDAEGGVGPSRGPGYPNALGVELSVWRLLSVRVERGTAGRPPGRPADGAGRRFTFDPTGRDRPLFRRAGEPGDRCDPPAPGELPVPLTCELLAHDLAAGRESSLAVWCAGPGGELRRVSEHRMRAGDLATWTDLARDRGVEVVVDPDRGRLMFAHPAPERVRVSYCYGTPGPLGAGPHPQGAPPDDGEVMRVAADGAAAVTLGPLSDAMSASTRTIVLEDSDIHRPDGAGWRVLLAAGQTLCVMAGPETMPLLLGDLTVHLSAGARLELRGITLLGTVELSGEGELALAFTTLVPASRPSVRCAHGSRVAISLERSITGPIHAGPAARLAGRESIVDGAGSAAVGHHHAAVGELDLRGVTVLGAARAGAAVVEQSIVTGALTVASGSGVLVHSYVGPGSSTGARIDCASGDAGLRPRFTSTRWGDPGYGQLSLDCPDVIAGGAGAGGEMGAFSWLDQPTRFARLERVLGEMLPAGLSAGVTYRN